jgi:hypothetical protein
MDSITTYSEARLEGTRLLTLFPDRVVVKANAMAAESLSTVDLKALNPDPDSMRYRNPIFMKALWLLGIGIFGLVFFIDSFWTKAWVPQVFFSLIATGLGGLALTFRKLEVVRLKNDSGFIALDVVRAGKDAARMDEFVELLKRQIRVARDGV